MALCFLTRRFQVCRLGGLPKSLKGNDPFFKIALMSSRNMRLYRRAALPILGVVLGMTCVPSARGGEAESHSDSVAVQSEGASTEQHNDLPAFIAKVRSSVVQIKVKTKNHVALGNGFVIDASGLIATSYHLIEGAKTITVVLLADKDRATLGVEGWVASEPSWDLAILRVDPGRNAFRPLFLADSLPARGEKVLRVGEAICEGTVAAVRSGRELSEMLQRSHHSDLYRNRLGYDLDMQWIQSTAPISVRSAGSPLVNLRGQLVGVAVWQYHTSKGQFLNFYVSSPHLRQLLAKTRAKALPLSELPPPAGQH